MNYTDKTPAPTSDQNKKGYIPRANEKNAKQFGDKARDMASSQGSNETKERKNLDEYTQPNPKRPIDSTVDSKV